MHDEVYVEIGDGLGVTRRQASLTIALMRAVSHHEGGGEFATEAFAKVLAHMGKHMCCGDFSNLCLSRKKANLLKKVVLAARAFAEYEEPECQQQ